MSALPATALTTAPAPTPLKARGFLHFVRHGAGLNALYIVTYNRLVRSIRPKAMLAEGAQSLIDLLERIGLMRVELLDAPPLQRLTQPGLYRSRNVAKRPLSGRLSLDSPYGRIRLAGEPFQLLDHRSQAGFSHLRDLQHDSPFLCQSTRKSRGEQEAKKLRFAPDELITVEGCCDEKLGGLRLGRSLFHPHYFAETAKIHLRAMQVRERHNVFDRSAQRHIGFRREQHATRTDVASLGILAHMPGPGSHDAKG